MQAAEHALPLDNGGLSSPLARSLYIAVVALMTGIVLLGFWPFYAALPSGGSGAHWIIYLHAAVFSGWMLLLFAQVILVYRRQARVHQRLGRIGIYYGLLVLLLGLVVTFVAPIQGVLAGRSSLDEAAGFLILPLGDMLLFAGFFAAGIAYRRRKELHKRLMVLATIALIFPAAARIGADTGLWAVLAIWLLPLCLVLAHDAVTRRRVEPVYVVGTVVFLVAFARIELMDSALWLALGRRLVTMFM